MATGEHGAKHVEKAEVSSPPAQAVPPSTNPDKPTGAVSLLQSDTAYKIDAESSNDESELRVAPSTRYSCSHTPTKVPSKDPLTRLKLAVGLSVRPSDTPRNYRVP